MIHPTVRILYYMFLNDGKCDADCVWIRTSILPLTINDCQNTIETLCRHLEEESHVTPGSIIVNRITTDFSHFKRQRNNYIPIPKQIHRIIKTVYKMIGPFRRTT